MILKWLSFGRKKKAKAKKARKGAKGKAAAGKKAAKRPKLAKRRVSKTGGKGGAAKGRRRAPAGRRAAAGRAAKAAAAREKQIGFVTHYFPRAGAGAVMLLKGTLARGEVIHIKGHTTDFTQKVASLQIDRVPVEKGARGSEVGIALKARVRINDTVYKA